MLHYTVNQRLNRACQQYGHTGGTRGNPGVARCREMATLPAGYIPHRKVPPASDSGSLNLIFIVCVQCCRMVDSVPIRHSICIL